MIIEPISPNTLNEREPLVFCSISNENYRERKKASHLFYLPEKEIFFRCDLTHSSIPKISTLQASFSNYKEFGQKITKANEKNGKNGKISSIKNSQIPLDLSKKIHDLVIQECMLREKYIKMEDSEEGQKKQLIKLLQATGIQELTISDQHFISEEQMNIHINSLNIEEKIISLEKKQEDILSTFNQLNIPLNKDQMEDFEELEQLKLKVEVALRAYTATIEI